MNFLSKRILITTVLIVIAISVLHASFIYMYYDTIRSRSFKQTISELESISKDYKDIFLANTILDQEHAIELLRDELKSNKDLNIVEWKCITSKTCSYDNSSQLTNGVLELTQFYNNEGNANNCCTLTIGRNVRSVVARTEYKRHIYQLILFTTFLILVIGIGIMLTMKKYFTTPISKIFNLIDHLSNDQLHIEICSSKNEFGDITNKLSLLGKNMQLIKHNIANQSKLATIGQISAHIAHDMRTPLSVLKAYVNNESNVSNEEAVQYKSAAMRSVDKLLRMADGMVDYSKATNIERSNIQLNKLIREGIVIEAYDEIQTERINTAYHGSDNVFVNIDSGKIERVLTNLVYNALQATDHNSERVNVAAHIEGKDLLISVSDNGKGIDPQHLPEIFDAFFTAGKKSGTGLGLSYCKQVVEAHGGTIAVHSKLGKGTIFTIRIPHCVVQQETPIKITNTESLKYTGKRFAIVDDDDDVRLMWKKTIQDNGGQVIWESDSAEKVIRDETYSDCSSIDAAIVDYKFSESDITGIDAIKYLKTKGIQEIHLCTGFADNKEIRKTAIEAGASSVIAKQ